MRLTKKDILLNLRQALQAELDEMMCAASFSRRSNSITYSRKCESGKQNIRMNVAFNPQYQTRATSHIYPYIELCFIELNQLAQKMLESDFWLSNNPPEFTISQPIDFVIPKEHHMYWYTYELESIMACVKSIKLSIERWVIPFLNQYTNVDSITSAYESKDERLVMQKYFYVYVAAAYLLLGQPESAMQVLEGNLGQRGPRRDFAKAFEYVQARLGS